MIPFDVAHVSSSLYMGSRPAILTSTNNEVAVGAVVDVDVPGMTEEEEDATAAAADDDAIGVGDDAVVEEEEDKDNKAVLISCNNKSRNTFSYPSKTAMSDHGCANVLSGPRVTINATEHVLSAELSVEVCAGLLPWVFCTPVSDDDGNDSKHMALSSVSEDASTVNGMLS